MCLFESFLVVSVILFPLTAEFTTSSFSAESVFCSLSLSLSLSLHPSPTTPLKTHHLQCHTLFLV